MERAGQVLVNKHSEPALVLTFIRMRLYFHRCVGPLINMRDQKETDAYTPRGRWGKGAYNSKVTRLFLKRSV